MVDVEGCLPGSVSRELDPLRCGAQLPGDSPPSRLGRGAEALTGEAGGKGGTPATGESVSPVKGRRGNGNGRPNGGSLSTYIKTIDTGDSCSLSGTSCRSKHSQEVGFLASLM
eukprot:evm.model.scf_12EXC.16 EVM.evm.TU.scf_12EXC.16   scf_12EXC:145719-146811(+)